jgi:hypothetical protein
VSYRRTDSAGTAGRLSDSLSRHFGAGQVFRDVDSIEAGEDFEQAIGAALRAAPAVLVVIGPRWLEASPKGGPRRIDDPLDYVRREIEMALAASTLVIPVLVDGARLPAAEDLPASIRDLTKRNAAELTDPRWKEDARGLIRRLEETGKVAHRRHVARTALRSFGETGAMALARFVPNLLLLLRAPRRFLARRPHGQGPDVASAFVFFTLTVLLALTVLLVAYIPRGSAVRFVAAGLAVGLVATAALSVPLWVGWRLAGARRHYPRLVAILLHQMAVAHLAALLAASSVIVALDIGSLNVVGEMMDEALSSGQSAEAALRGIDRRLEPLLMQGAVRVGLVLAVLLLLGGAVWLVRSWGAYRDAFGLGRWRSLAAFTMSVLAAWAGSQLVTLLAWSGR